MNPDSTNPNDIAEYRSLTSVLTAHLKYGQWARQTILNPKKLKWQSLTDDEKELLPWFPSYLELLDSCIKTNENFFREVALTTDRLWQAGRDPSSWSDCSSQDLDKLRGIMIQYVREWSDICVKERDNSMGRILRKCEELFPNIDNRPNVNVLVPGAGLGRLVVEFVKRGFCTQGNEFSYHMLLNSSFILNASYRSNNFCICPFIHKQSNNAEKKYQTRQVFFPDFYPPDVSLISKEHPNILVGELMSMVAGSFVDLYGPSDLNKVNETYTESPKAVKFRKTNRHKFDVVATCFFIDTASNIIDYLKTIKNCLSDNGYWVNFGPLLWHHEDDDDVIESIIIDPVTKLKQKVITPMKGLELSREDLIQLIKDMGFEFIDHISDIESTYGGDPMALGNWSYKSEFWVCQKVKN
ncbi:DEBR0S3_10814g1_1 [Brettanomyces bruxellensis]|uniref:carnosine N-methyltransferase n=1 Tax=Dekkera bruxellensis TaxID=5007 RepID=A0A3F2Y4G4_DEKBR|nr:DEBR0S3_10814g1_1 [Brettanomyces bruxellensis]